MYTEHAWHEQTVGLFLLCGKSMLSHSTTHVIVWSFDTSKFQYGVGECSICVFFFKFTLNAGSILLRERESLDLCVCGAAMYGMHSRLVCVLCRREHCVIVLSWVVNEKSVHGATIREYFWSSRGGAINRIVTTRQSRLVVAINSRDYSTSRTSRPGLIFTQKTDIVICSFLENVKTDFD